MLPEVLKVDRKKREVILKCGDAEFTVRVDEKNNPIIILEMTHAQIYDPLRTSNATRAEVLRRAAAILKKPYQPRRTRLPRQLSLPF